MNTTSLKFKVLERLFELYIERPDKYISIHDMLEESGVNSEASIISFGYALKSAGFLKSGSACNSEGAFMACISVNGIDFVSTAIKDETRQLIRFAIDKDTNDFLPLNDHLKLIPGNSEYAQDISKYLKENNLAEIKEENGQFYFKLSELAFIIFNTPPHKWESGEGESDANRKFA